MGSAEEEQAHKRKNAGVEGILRRFAHESSRLNFNFVIDGSPVVAIFLPNLAKKGGGLEERLKEPSLSFSALRDCQAAFAQISRAGKTAGAHELEQALGRGDFLGVKIAPPRVAEILAEIHADHGGFVAFKTLQESSAFKAEMASARPSLTQRMRQMSKDKLAAAPGVASFAERYKRVAALAKKLVNHNAFDGFIVTCILLVGIATVIELESEDGSLIPPELPDNAYGRRIRKFLYWTERLTLGVFTSEVVLKILSKGDAPLEYFTDPEDGSWNTFDFVVVLMSYVSNVSLMRLLRLLKVMGKVEELRVLLLGLVAGIRAVTAIMILLMLVIFLYAVVGVLYFGGNDPGHFGNLERAMLTLFQCATLSWADTFLLNYYGCDVYSMGLYVPSREVTSVQTKYGDFTTWGCNDPGSKPERLVTIIYFVSYTVLTAFVILNLFISVITMAMFEIIQMKDQEKAEELVAHEVPSDERRARMRALISNPASGTSAAIMSVMHIDEATTVALAAAGVAGAAHAHDHEHVDLDASLEAGTAAAAGSNGGEDDGLEIKPCPIGRAAHVSAIVTCARRIAQHPKFGQTIVAAIFVVAFLEALVTNGHGSEWTRKANMVILVLFTFEAAVKIVSKGNEPRRYFRDNWNKFDFFIVFMSWLGMVIPVGSTSFFRLLRLLRVLKLLHTFPTLAAVTQSLLNAFTSVGYVMLMFIVINFVLATSGMTLFRRNDKQNFGSFVGAMMTIWRIETGDGWNDIMYMNVVGCDEYGYSQGFPTTANTSITVYPDYAPYAADGVTRVGQVVVGTAARDCFDPQPMGWLAVGYFVCVLLLGGMVMPTVLIGVISIAFEDATKQIAERRLAEKCVQRVLELGDSWLPGEGKFPFLTETQFNTVRSLFADVDFDDDGNIDEDEMTPFLEYLADEFLGGHEILRIHTMFEHIDTSGDGKLQWPEFLWFIVYFKRLFLERTGKLAPLADADADAPAKPPGATSAGGGGYCSDSGVDLPVLDVPVHERTRGGDEKAPPFFLCFSDRKLDDDAPFSPQELDDDARDVQAALHVLRSRTGALSVANRARVADMCMDVLREELLASRAADDPLSTEMNRAIEAYANMRKAERADL